MSDKGARWIARPILGAAGVGALSGLAYFFQALLPRFSVAIVFTFTVFSASAFAMFAMFRTATQIGFFPILAVAGGLGGLVFSLAYRTSLPWSIVIGCVIGLAAPLVFLLTRRTSHSAGEKESE